MPYPSLLHPEPLALRQSTADLSLHRRCSNTVLSWSLWGPRVLVCTRFVWALWASLVGMGFDSKFSPLNLSLLLSCLSFSFALGHRVSPSCGSSKGQLQLLTLDLVYLFTAAPVPVQKPPHSHLLNFDPYHKRIFIHHLVWKALCYTSD